MIHCTTLVRHSQIISCRNTHEGSTNHLFFITAPLKPQCSLWIAMPHLQTVILLFSSHQERLQYWIPDAVRYFKYGKIMILIWSSSSVTYVDNLFPFTCLVRLRVLHHSWRDIVITNVKVEKLNGTENRIDGWGRRQLVFGMNAELCWVSPSDGREMTSNFVFSLRVSIPESTFQLNMNSLLQFHIYSHQKWELDRQGIFGDLCSEYQAHQQLPVNRYISGSKEHWSGSKQCPNTK